MFRLSTRRRADPLGGECSTHTPAAHFQNNIVRFNSTLKIIDIALKSEVHISQPDLQLLHKLKKISADCGFSFGHIEELDQVRQEVERTISTLKENEKTIQVFAQKNNIPYDGTREKLKQIDHLTELILMAPVEHLGLQSSELTREGAAKSISQLNNLQNEIISIETILNKKIYLDALPEIKEIKEAISTFREGDSWYRIFQSHWRKAKNVHIRLQKNKTKVPVKERLEDLEKIILWDSTKIKWATDPTWKTYLGISVPASPISLDGYVTLATWNSAIKVASEDLRVSIIDSISFTTEKARLLRRDFSEISGNLAAVRSSLTVIDSRLKTIGELVHPISFNLIFKQVDELVAVLSQSIPWLMQNAKPKVGLEQVITSCEAAIERGDLANTINSADDTKALLKDHYASVNTNCDHALLALDFGLSINELKIADPIKRKLKSNNPLELAKIIKNLLENISCLIVQV